MVGGGELEDCGENLGKLFDAAMRSSLARDHERVFAV